LAKHLTAKDITAIVNLIQNHSGGKISWDQICDASELIVGKRPTRQSLSNHSGIKQAYDAKKLFLKNMNSQNLPKPSSLNSASETIAKLKAENELLKRKNSSLLEKFVVWQYNAYKYGMKEHQLNESLPRIDRERSD